MAGLYNISVSMPVNRASKNAVAQYFYVHGTTISRLQTRFNHSVTVWDRQRRGCPRVTTPDRKTVLFIHCTLRNHTSNAALTMGNIPGMTTRHITGQTV